MLPQTLRPATGLGHLSGFLGFAHFRLSDLVASVLIVLIGLLYVLLLTKAKLSVRPLLLTVGVALAFTFLAPTLFSTDVFGYQAYSTMFLKYGVSPYTHGPYPTMLQDPLYPYLGATWIKTPTEYGQIFTILSLPTRFLDAAWSVLYFKGLDLLAMVVTLGAIWKLVPSFFPDASPSVVRERQLRGVAAYALNPLVLLYGLGGGHNDLLAVAVMCVGIYYCRARGQIRGGPLLLSAPAIKLTTAVALPFVLADDLRRGRRGLLKALAVTLVVLLVLGLAVFGVALVHLPTTLAQAQSESVGWTLPGTLERIPHLRGLAQPVGIVEAALFLGLSVRLLLNVWKGRSDWLVASTWCTFFLLVLSSGTLPWYFSWLAAPLAIIQDRRLERWGLLLGAWMLVSVVLDYIPSTAL